MSEVPEFDNRDFPEGTFDNPYPEANQESTDPSEIITEEPSATAIEKSHVSPKPLEEVFADNEARMREYDAMKEDLESRNWPPGRITQKLDTTFPDLRTAERIEEIAVQEDARARRAASGSVSKKRAKRYYGPRDAGPPPNIAKDVRKAQGFTDI